ncbi:fimbrial protein [Rahnella sp. Lac-M11]|jgi:type 1 fimbria pilin|uniref:Fimbrial protein n=1 Tax=Rahnella contaminans TaxID=2703882 RepID=A0A6M2AZF1_9GAMM|nr:fimbrial protein [Rahnella contaminans]KAB8308966.1 type 1 fimbrial protein [Rouxiella chamberiensis]NGX85863.1 fimbrial protein [Rahnella contaminans]
MKIWPALLLTLLAPVCSQAGVLHCDIDSGGAAPFSPYTRENPVAVDQNTPDYTVVLALDYAQFLPNMRLTCTSDGNEFEAPANFDGTISLSLSAVNDSALDWAGEAQTTNNGIKMKMYIKAVQISEETPPASYPAAQMASGKRLGVEYPIINGKDDTTLVQFGAQYNAGKTLYKYDKQYNFAIESMRAELIKFGWMEYQSQAVIPPGAHLTFTIDGLGGIATVDVPLGSGVYMAAPSCSLDNKHQTVDLGNISKTGSGTFPQKGPLVRFGMDFTCSSYTNNVEFTFDEPYTVIKGRDTLSTTSVQNGEKLQGLEVGLFDSEGNTVRMGVKQNLGVGQKGKNTANFQAAIIQTAAKVTDASNNDFTGNFTAKADVTITYY